MGAADGGTGCAPRPLRRAPHRARARDDPRLLPRPPDRQHARAVCGPRPGAAHAARQGRAVVPVRRALRARRRHPGRSGDARGCRGVRHRRAAARPGARPAERARRTVLRPARRRPPPRRPLRRGGRGHRRARGQRGVAGRALVAGRRASRAGTRPGRAGRPGARPTHAIGSVHARRCPAATRRGTPPTSRAGSPWPARPSGSGRPTTRTSRRGRARAGARARGRARSR